MGNPEGELSVLFTDGAEIKRLNSKYRSVPKTTDVLSFSSRADVGPATLGDIIISIPTAKRQAAGIGSSLERETLFLLTHGLLHILGYDHERSPKEAEKMKRLQQKLMATGYGA